MKTKDQLEAALSEFAEKLPEVKRRLLDERDIYIAQKIRHADGPKVVAVVGAGHIWGIKKSIKKEQSLDELIKIPPKSFWPTIFKWAIPAAVIALITYSLFAKGTEAFLQNIYVWLFVNGSLSALGAAVALAHPVTILSAFIAAPFTSLNPAFAAGWVAGLVEAWIRKPTVDDFEQLPTDTSTVKGFWKNPVTRILLIVAFANIGSVLGTWIAGIWIGKESVT